jgi:cell wall-associated NlpC family hydrolase
MSGAALAAAAAALAGTRFRLHGRDPATGLDCVGLLAAALAAIGRPAPLPSGYRLRMRAVPRLAAIAAGCGLAEAAGPAAPGDILLVRPAPCQLHLVIALGGHRFVHAHAGLGRVVLSGRPLAWPIVGHWRL